MNSLVVSDKTSTIPEKGKKILHSSVPKEILEDPLLSHAIKSLPENYNFEIHKTVWKIRSLGIERVALQFPEGLLIFANLIADILESFTEAEVMILGDVTYGACCVDDFTSRKLGAQLLVHYGHSCLIPISLTPGIQMLYVFVDIKINSLHFTQTLIQNFPPKSKLALVSTIQFITTLQTLSRQLGEQFNIVLPQSKPLSPGEILGCTSPILPQDTQALIYLGDGRFHIESIMIHNPGVPSFKYDPYNKKLTVEKYNTNLLLSNRKSQIDKAKYAGHFGLVMGTLGRQGSPVVVNTLRRKLEEAGKNVTLILMSELNPSKLRSFSQIETWVQVACPRLSIDWGLEYDKPLLTPYETNVLLGSIEFKDRYPMDFYSYQSLGDWTVNFDKIKKNKKTKI